MLCVTIAVARVVVVVLVAVWGVACIHFCTLTLTCVGRLGCLGCCVQPSALTCYCVTQLVCHFVWDGNGVVDVRNGAEVTGDYALLMSVVAMCLPLLPFVVNALVVLLDDAHCVGHIVVMDEP